MYAAGRLCSDAAGAVFPAPPHKPSLDVALLRLRSALRRSVRKYLRRQRPPKASRRQKRTDGTLCRYMMFCDKRKSKPYVEAGVRRRKRARTAAQKSENSRTYIAAINKDKETCRRRAWERRYRHGDFRADTCKAERRRGSAMLKGGLRGGAGKSENSRVYNAAKIKTKQTLPPTGLGKAVSARRFSSGYVLDGTKAWKRYGQATVYARAPKRARTAAHTINKDKETCRRRAWERRYRHGDFRADTCKAERRRSSAMSKGGLRAGAEKS